MLRIKLVRSPIGHTKSNRATVTSLGLRKMNQVVEHPDIPDIRGMVHKVKHLLTVETVDDAPGAESTTKVKATAKAAAPAKAPAAKKAAPAKAKATPGKAKAKAKE